MLHEQEAYSGSPMLGSITHWGSDKRSVDVMVVRDQSAGIIVLTAYSDWAGIE